MAGELIDSFNKDKSMEISLLGLVRGNCDAQNAENDTFSLYLRLKPNKYQQEHLSILMILTSPERSPSTADVVGCWQGI